MRSRLSCAYSKKRRTSFRLLPKARDHDSYLAIIARKGEPTGRTADALAYFEEQPAALVDTEPDKLRQLFEGVRQNRPLLR
jgi:hypothetical protein